MPYPTRQDALAGQTNALANKKLGIAKLGSEKEMIQRRINATDAEIDRLVYELYGLTDEELAIVEGKSA
jgi:hypothetical protein